MDTDKVIELAGMLSIELSVNQTGLPTNKDNIFAYKAISALAKKLKDIEMNQRKMICSVLSQKHSIKSGTTKTVKDDIFKYKIKNNLKKDLDLESVGAENLDDFFFVLEDELTEEEKECFERKLIFSDKKFKNILKEKSEDVVYALENYMVTKDAAPELTITEI